MTGPSPSSWDLANQLAELGDRSALQAPPGRVAGQRSGPRHVAPFVGAAEPHPHHPVSGRRSRGSRRGARRAGGRSGGSALAAAGRRHRGRDAERRTGRPPHRHRTRKRRRHPLGDESGAGSRSEEPDALRARRGRRPHDHRGSPVRADRDRFGSDRAPAGRGREVRGTTRSSTLTWFPTRAGWWACSGYATSCWLVAHNRSRK